MENSSTATQQDFRFPYRRSLQTISPAVASLLHSNMIDEVIASDAADCSAARGGMKGVLIKASHVILAVNA